MLGQFIPSFWLTAFPLLIVVGIPIVTLTYWVLSRLKFLRPANWKSRFKLFGISIVLTASSFWALNYLSWRFTEYTTPTAVDIRTFAGGGASMTKFINRFGEPSDRSRSNNGNDTLEYPAIIEYSSGRWGGGLVTVEFNMAGDAIETWTAD